MSKIIIIGPGHPLRGGLATFNQRLVQQFQEMGHDCSICSFSLQYPSIFFPGKTQYSDEPAPKNMLIRPMINSINPLNWVGVGNKLRDERPDIIVVRYWIPFMGPALGTILRRVKKNKHTRIICIADNVIPHEHRPGDRTFTRYFLKSCDAFITMSEKVMNDLKTFIHKKPARLVQHPLYDNFGDAIPKQQARETLGLLASDKIILFFGFIRNYKGLDILLRAMADERIRKQNIKLLVAGEFYEEPRPYRELIEQLKIHDQLILRTDFIPDHEVRDYLCAADAVIQPYRNATQSGVTPLAYHFKKPMVVTNVGGLPALVPNEKTGIVVPPEPTQIADGILRIYQLGENYFVPHLRNEKLKYSWSRLADTIIFISQMIYRSKAPLRIGLAGGGTDVSPYSDLYGGAILNATISLYAYATIEPIEENGIILNAIDRQEEERFEWTDQLPLNGKLDLLKGVYNRIQKDHGLPMTNFRLSTYVDAPAGSGLGTSSTLVVAIIGAFAEMLRLPLGEYDCAHYAYDIERKDLKLAGGKQDQYAATFGGVNFMEFYADDKVVVNPLRIKQQTLFELENNLLLYYTSTSRESAKIIEQQAKNVLSKESKPIDAMHQLKQQAQMMREALLKGRLHEIGEILDFGFIQKRKMADGISNSLMDDTYETAKKAGATGGKISGAGGGGFMIFYCPGNTKHHVIQNLKKFGGEHRNYQFVEHGPTSWTI